MTCINPSGMEPIANKYGVSVENIVTASDEYLKKYNLEAIDENDPRYIEFIKNFFNIDKEIYEPNESRFNELQSYWNKTDNGVLNVQILDNAEEVISAYKEKFGENNVTVFHDFDNVKKIRVAKPIYGSGTTKSKSGNGKITLTDEQQNVVNNVVSFIKDRVYGRGNNDVPFITIQGMAGTGKTTVVRNIIQQIRKEGVYDTIAVSALSRKAVGVLFSKTKDLGVAKESLYTLAGANPNQSEDKFAIDPKKSKLHRYGVVFVDEASMVGPHMYNVFLDYARKENVAIVFLGDYGQLRPIDKNGAISDKSPVFKEKTTKVETLTQRIRQGEDSPILPYADNFYDISVGRNQNHVSDFRSGKTVITDKGAIVFARNGGQSLSMLIDSFRSALESENPNHIKIVAGKNERVRELNETIHDALFPDQRGKISKGDLIIFNEPYKDAIENAEEFVVLDSFYDTTKQDVNGIHYIEFLIKNAEGKTFTVKRMENTPENIRLFEQKKAEMLAEVKRRNFWPPYYKFIEEYANFSLGYAITTHKAQGSTYDIVAVDVNDITGVGAWDNTNLAENIYTALTRARNVAIVLGEEDKTTPVSSYEELNNRIEGTTTTVNKQPLVKLPIEVKPESEQQTTTLTNNTPHDTNEQIVTAAPYFRQRLTSSNKEELEQKTLMAKQRAEILAEALGLKIKSVETIGGTYLGNSEITYQYMIDSDNEDAINLFASLMGDLSFEYQDAVIASNYVPKGKGNAIELTYSTPKNTTIEDIEKVLKDSGIDGSSFSFENNELKIIAFSEEELDNLIDKLNKIEGYEYKEHSDQNSRYLDNEGRQNIYKTWLNSKLLRENWSLRNACQKALAICEAAAKFSEDNQEKQRINAAKEAAAKWDKDFKFSKVESKLNTVINFCNSHFVFDEKNHEYHVIQNGKVIATAKKTASGFKYYSSSKELRYEPIKPEDLKQWYIPSTRLGTTVDTITRDFFRGELTLEDVLTERKTYPNFKSEQLYNLVSDLRNLKKWADDNDIRLISADFPMIGSINGELVGGAMDLLGYDMNGNIYIFDMKNKRSENEIKDLKRAYSGQQNVYTGLFNTMCQATGVNGLNVKSLKILQFNGINKVPEYRDTWYEAGEDNQIYVKGTNERIQDMSDYNAPRLIFENGNIPKDFTIDLTDVIYEQIKGLSSDILEEITGTKNPKDVMVDVKNQLGETGQVVPDIGDANRESNALHDGTIKDSDLLEIANGVIIYASTLYDKIAKGDDNAQKLYQKITGIEIPNIASREYNDFQNIIKAGRENITSYIPVQKVLNYIKESIWREDAEFVENGGLEEVDENGNNLYTDREKYIYNTIKKCYDNFDALVEHGYAKFAQLEKKSLSFGIGKEEMHLDGEPTETQNIDTETLSNKDLEHWMVEQMSVKNSLSDTWRRIISKIYEYETVEEDGETKQVIKYSEFGLPKTLPSDAVINNLLYWFKGCTNVDEMISVLNKRLRYYPEYTPILRIIENDEQLKSQFFQNFRKDFQVYSIVIANKNKQTGKIEYITKVINNSSAADFLMSKLGYKFATGFSLLNDVFSVNKEGLKNPKIEKINEYENRISRIKTILKNPENLTKEEYRKEFSDLLASFGLNFNRQTVGMFFDDIAESKNPTFATGKLGEVFGYLHNILEKCKVAKNLNYSLFKENPITKVIEDKDGNLIASEQQISVRNEYKNILEIFNDYLEEFIESSCYENEKMHYSFNPPSYTGKLFINLKSSAENPQKFDDFIEKEYGKYKWFATNSDKPRDQVEKRMWLNPMLDVLHETDNDGNLTALAKKARSIIGHKTQLAFNKTAYVDLSALGYLTSIFTEYFCDNSKEGYKKANYKVPILSNKPSSEFVTFIRFDNSNYKSQMIKYFKNVAIQELMRMRTVLERATDSRVEPIKNYDLDKKKHKRVIQKLNPGGVAGNALRLKALTWEDINSLSGTGVEFKFLSFLNNLDSNIEGAKELKQYILDYLNHRNADESLLNDNFGKVFTQKMNETFEKQMDYFRSIGLFDFEYSYQNGKITSQRFKNLDFLTLRGKNVAEQETEAKQQLENFFWNDFLASINIIELTATDLAYYKNVEDFQKRFAQIHAPGLRLDVTAKTIIKDDENEDGRLVNVSDGKSRTAYIKDKEYNTGIEDDVAIAFDKLIEKESNVDKKKALSTMKSVVARALKGVNVADAQAFTSPTGMMKKLVMAGKWTNDMSEAYYKICSGNFDLTDLNVLIQPLKPFVYSQIEKNSYAQTMNNLKVGLQNKNSEYMILLSDAIMRGAKQNNKLVALFDFMEASAYDGRTIVRNGKVYTDNVFVRNAEDGEHDGQILKKGVYNGHGIDTIQFESAVKVGLEGVININDKTLDDDTEIARKYDEIIKDLKTKTTSGIEEKLYDDRFVHEFDYEDYAVQQEVPPHLVDHKQLMGSQMRVLAMSDMPFNTQIDFVTRNGEKLDTAGKLINYYQELIAENIKDSFKILEKELKFDENTDRKTRNKVMRDLLRSEMQKDARYGADLKRACELGPDGEFIIPLSDPIQSVRIQQLIHSIIKSRINKQKVPGGPVVQATSWGIDKKYRIRWKGEKEGENKKSPVLKTIDDFNTKEEYLSYLRKKLKSLAYFECAMPVPSAELERDLIALAKKIDGDKYNGRLATPQEAIGAGLMTESQLKAIGYRIPTEDKYSMYPMKVVEWVPRAAGEVVILPEEITKLTGSDFDIDKTYIYLKSFTRIVDVEGLKDLLKRKGDNYSEEDVKNIIKRWNKGETTVLDGLIAASNKSFVHYKEKTGKKNKEDSSKIDRNKDDRNNEIFDIQWKLLTHPSTMDKMFNPGSFDPQKKTARIIQILKITNAYEYTDLVKMPLDKLEDILKSLSSNTDTNICYIDTQIRFHQQNMTAGKLIGIFANNNVSHAFVQPHNVLINFDPSQKIIFDGITFNGSMKLDSMYALDGVTYISKNIAGYLGASVDAVKDPVLNYLNLNTFTSGVGMLLTRLGFDIDSVGLFLSQPSIIKATNLYNNLNNDGYVSASDAVAKILNEMDSGWVDSLNQQSSSLSKIELANNLNGSDDSFQIEVLKTFYKLLTPAQNLNNLTFITKFNSISNAAGPNISDTILLSRRVSKFLNNLEPNSKNQAFSVNAKDVLFKSPILNAFYEYTISDENGAAKKIFENWFPHYTDDFVDIIDQFEQGSKSPLDNRTIDKLLNEFILYKLTYKDSPFAEYFTPDKRNYYINKFPKEFVEFKDKHPELANNVLLSAINIKAGTKKCDIYTLDSQVGGYSSEMQELAKTNWSDMLQSSDSEVREMAKKLFIYCLYRNGFGFSPKTFIHLASVKTKQALGYTGLINDLEFFTKSFNVENFLEQFRRNHITELRIVPNIEIGTNKIGTVLNLNNGNTLVFECKKRVFINDLLSYDKQRPVAVIKYGNNYYRLVDFDNTDSDSAYVKYEKTEPLGNKNNFLEYDMNERLIQSVISKDAVDNNNAENEPDTNDFESKPGSSSSEINTQQEGDYIKKVGNQRLDDLQKELKDLGLKLTDNTSSTTTDLLNLDDKTKEQVDKTKKDNNICDF